MSRPREIVSETPRENGTRIAVAVRANGSGFDRASSMLLHHDPAEDRPWTIDLPLDNRSSRETPGILKPGLRSHVALHAAIGGSGQMINGKESVIFVIDDNQAVRESISGLLRSVGLHSKSFSSPRLTVSSRRRPRAMWL